MATAKKSDKKQPLKAPETIPWYKESWVRIVNWNYGNRYYTYDNRHKLFFI